MTDGLQWEGPMPLTWHDGEPNPAQRQVMLREAALLLAAVNQLEAGRETDATSPDNRRLDRLEAKLDLALHLLARVLEPQAASGARTVRLGAETLAWDDDAPPAAGQPLVLRLRPSDQLPLTLELPAVAQAPERGQARARFLALPEDLADALTQFVFRRHRQAIRARSG